MCLACGGGWSPLDTLAVRHFNLFVDTRDKDGQQKYTLMGAWKRGGLFVQNGKVYKTGRLAPRCGDMIHDISGRGRGYRRLNMVSGCEKRRVPSRYGAAAVRCNPCRRPCQSHAEPAPLAAHARKNGWLTTRHHSANERGGSHCTWRGEWGTRR